MNINWAAIANEMKVLNYVREFLELDNYPEIAVIIAANLNECGSLTQAMRDAVITMKQAASNEDDEDESEEDRYDSDRELDDDEEGADVE